MKTFSKLFLTLSLFLPISYLPSQCQADLFEFKYPTPFTLEIFDLSPYQFEIKNIVHIKLFNGAQNLTSQKCTTTSPAGEKQPKLFKAKHTLPLLSSDKIEFIFEAIQQGSCDLRFYGGDLFITLYSYATQKNHLLWIKLNQDVVAKPYYQSHDFMLDKNQTEKSIIGPITVDSTSNVIRFINP